jgi:hypothetical protein
MTKQGLFYRGRDGALRGLSTVKIRFDLLLNLGPDTGARICARFRHNSLRRFVSNTNEVELIRGA